MSWLSAERYKLGISVTDLSKALGVTRPTYYSYEKEPLKLTLEHMQKLIGMGFNTPLHEKAMHIAPVNCPTCNGTGKVFRLEYGE